MAAWAGHSPQVMFSHYANVIEELVGEPRIPVEDQIKRARDVVEDKAAEELDNLAAELFAWPNVASAGKSGGQAPLRARCQAVVVPSRPWRMMRTCVRTRPPAQRA